MPAKAGPSLRVPGGRRPDPPRPHCLLPHWRPQTWDFPDENTDGPFILSFSPIICTHSFTHQTTSPFRHVLPRPSQLSGRDRASAKNLSLGQALPEGIQGLWETQGGGRAIRWGIARGLGDVLHTGFLSRVPRRDRSVSAKQKVGAFWPCRFRV